MQILIKQLFTAYKNSFTGLSRETWILSIVMLINRSSSMAVPFMSLYMTEYLHRQLSDAGLIISLYGIGAIIGAAAGGKLTDMVGFRTVQILSAIIGGLFFIFFSTITHFHTLCLLTVIISFFSEAFRPANFAAIATYAAAGTETRSYALNRLATNLGWAVGSSIGGIVASFNYQLLFVADGSVSIIAGILILYFLPAVTGYRKTAEEKVKDVFVRMPWKDILFVKFLLLTTILATCFYLMFRVVPLFYKEVWHINEMLIGLVLGANGLIIALFEMVIISKLENKRSPVFYMITGVLFISAAYLVLMSPRITPVLIAMLSITLFTIGEMFALPFINTFVMSRTNAFNRGQYAAGYMLSWSVAQVIGPSAGFYLAEKCGYNWLWILLVMLSCGCALGFKLLASAMNRL